MSVALIVAMTPQRVIGRNNALPWHLPEDLQHFKRITMGHTIIMGRKTFESIGKPLPGRHNVVISRNTGWKAEGVTAVISIEAAIKAADPAAGPVFVIGGAQIYQLALPLADELFVTLVHDNIEGDTVFPDPDWSRWQLVERSARQRSRTGIEFTLTHYRRMAAG